MVPNPQSSVEARNKERQTRHIIWKELFPCHQYLTLQYTLPVFSVFPYQLKLFDDFFFAHYFVTRITWSNNIWNESSGHTTLCHQ